MNAWVGVILSFQSMYFWITKIFGGGWLSFPMKSRVEAMRKALQ